MASSPGQQRTRGPRGLLRVGRGFSMPPRDQPRVRRATDVIGLVASLLALTGLLAAPPIWGWFALTWLRRNRSL